MCYLTFKRARGRPKKTLEKPSPPDQRKYHSLDLLKKKRLIDAKMWEAGIRFEQEFLSYKAISRLPHSLNISSLIRKERGSGLKTTGPDSLKEIKISQRCTQARAVLTLSGEGVMSAILSLLDENLLAEEALGRLLKRIPLSKVRKGLAALWVHYSEGDKRQKFQLLESHT